MTQLTDALSKLPKRVISLKVMQAQVTRLKHFADAGAPTSESNHLDKVQQNRKERHTRLTRTAGRASTPLRSRSESKAPWDATVTMR